MKDEREDSDLPFFWWLVCFRPFVDPLLVRLAAALAHARRRSDALIPKEMEASPSTFTASLRMLETSTAL